VQQIIDEFQLELKNLQKGIIKFSETDGEKIPGEMEISEPLLFSFVSETMEEASKNDITTEEGVLNIRKKRMKHKRFEEWYTRQSK